MITVSSVAISQVALAPGARIDARYFTLFPMIEQVALGMRGWKVGSKVHLSNGVNLPEPTYDPTPPDSPRCLYVSVGALSQYTMRGERATALRDPDDFAYGFDLKAVAATDDDVLVTRSGTPGVAWPAVLRDPESLVIPSGFVIRARLLDSPFTAAYLSAILNHPVWRTWTSALATGKRQPNVSQDQLSDVLVPAASASVQEQIGADYVATVKEIDRRLSSASLLATRCDEILREHLGLTIDRVTRSPLTVDIVAISTAITAGGRIDARFHRGEVRRELAPLDSVATCTLGSLITGPLLKGVQPTLVEELEDAEVPRVVATSAIQGGTIVADLTKATIPAAIDAAGSRRLIRGDLLITMDGEGSIGKAAVFDGEYEALTDSHVAIARVGDADLANALACFINSTLGQAQVDLLTTGATGQTQVSVPDLVGIRVPESLPGKRTEIAQAFGQISKSYAEVGESIRRDMAALGQRTTAHLVASDIFDERGRVELTRLSELGSLLSLLETARVLLS